MKQVVPAARTRPSPRCSLLRRRSWLEQHAEGSRLQVSIALRLPWIQRRDSDQERGIHCLTQPAASLKNTRFHGAGGDAQNLGRFLDGTFFDVKKLDRASNLRTQAIDCSTQELLMLTPPAGLFRIGTPVDKLLEIGLGTILRAFGQGFENAALSTGATSTPHS